MMTFPSQKNEAYFKYAEVFTPPAVVIEMILQPSIRDCLKEVDKTIFDPAVGEGQYPCLELVWKLFFGLDKLDEEYVLKALKSLYGIDIQSSSVEKTKQHMFQTVCDSYKFFTGKEFTRLEDAKEIIDKNFLCGDALKFMKELADF